MKNTFLVLTLLIPLHSTASQAPAPKPSAEAQPGSPVAVACAPQPSAQAQPGAPTAAAPAGADKKPVLVDLTGPSKLALFTSTSDHVLKQLKELGEEQAVKRSIPNQQLLTTAIGELLANKSMVNIELLLRLAARKTAQNVAAPALSLDETPLHAIIETLENENKALAEKLLQSIKPILDEQDKISSVLTLAHTLQKTEPAKNTLFDALKQAMPKSNA